MQVLHGALSEIYLRVYLDDVINSGHLIDRYISEKTKQQFDTDDARKDSVIRRLEIIREAINGSK